VDRKSSFQELMELVAAHVESRSADDLLAIHEKLMQLREVFERDRDLLEAVIRRIEEALRERS
jgi:hypothetical protein